MSHPTAPPQHSTLRSDGLFAGAILAVAAALVAACGICWVAAQAAGLVAGFGTRHIPFATLPGFLTNLTTDGDLQTAWHTTYPHVGPLGPEWVFWTTSTLLLTVLVAVGVWVWIRYTSRQKGVSEVEPARWATRGHQRPITVNADPARRRWRLTAGHSTTTGKLLAGHDCVSAVAFGPNGSGKTTSLVVPNTLDWDGPVVLTTAKPQDLEPICSARAQVGPVWVIAPGGAPGHDLAGWSPIDYATDPEAADRVAEWMVDASGMTSDPKARPWNAQARKYLKGLLLAAHETRAEVDQWVEWIHAGERAADTIEDILTTAGHSRAAAEYASTWQIHDEGKGSVLFTALGLADTYTRPGIHTAASRTTITPTDLLDRSGTLCIVTSGSDTDRYAPYLTTLLSAIIYQAETRAAESAGPLDPRLLLALDEAGNVFRYPRLPHLLTTARGNGIQLLLIYHDLAQVEHLYGGPQVARTICSNAKMRMLLPGVGDLETLKYWSQMIGRTRIQTHGETRGYDGHRSRSTSDHDDNLAPLHLLQQLPTGQAILLYENLPPARVKLLPWFTDKRFRHLQRGETGRVRKVAP